MHLMKKENWPLLTQPNKGERNCPCHIQVFLSLKTDFLKFALKIKISKSIGKCIIFFYFMPVSLHSTEQAQRGYISTCWICFWVFSFTCLVLDMKIPLIFSDLRSELPFQKCSNFISLQYKFLLIQSLAVNIFIQLLVQSV